MPVATLIAPIRSSKSKKHMKVNIHKSNHSSLVKPTIRNHSPVQALKYFTLFQYFNQTNTFFCTFFFV